MEDQIDVSSESSSEIEQTEQTTQESEPAEAAPEQEAVSQEKTEENVPFHLHPRFQEVIFQKNQLAEQTKMLQQQLQELQSKFTEQKPAQSEEDKLIARLKGIDPEFGGRFAELDSLRSEMKQFKEWQAQMAAEKQQIEVNATKEKLFSDSKVPQERRAIYEAMIREEAIRNPKLQINDLPAVFKSVHENISKLFGSVEREVTKNYVQTKTQQAAKPASQPKGQVSKPKSDNMFSGNSREDRATLIQEVLKQARAEKDI